MSLRVLHLFSNAKWTGPAEPALNLCVALRGLGVDADFACAPDAGDSVNKVVETARDRGVEPILDFHLKKHRNPVYNWLDLRALTAYLGRERYDLLHCHLDNDHRIAAAVARRVGVQVVRSSYYGEGFPDKPGLAALAALADRIIEPSERALRHDVAAHGLDPTRLRVIPNAVDTDRFDPHRETPDGRRWLNVPHDAFVVGIVARMQTHRHFDDFFAAMRRLADAHPQAYVIVVGRGTHQEKVALEPVRRLGLRDRVRFSGYVDGENYVGMLRAFDVKAFLVPGSDGTCRAVREAMAMAKPIVTADRGMLAEIVDDGVNGFVCDGSGDGLFAALDRFARDRRLTREMGRAAREKALAEFALPVQARRVLDVYEAALGRG